MNKSKKTIICIAIAVVVIICVVILKNTVFAPKGAFKEGSSGVIEYSGYNVEGLHYGFNTQQECYLKTDNYNGVKEIDVNFAETAEQDVVLSLKFFDKDGNKLTDYINATWKKGTNYCRIPVKDSEKYSGYKIMIPHDFTLDSINFSSKEGGDLKSPN